jgi:hypothetical protein
MDMSKYANGEHIFLYFELYENEEFFKGWLTLDDCKEAIKETCGDDCEVTSIKRHGYARWNIGRDECGGVMSHLHEVTSQGRGVFKVTVCEANMV